MSQATLKSVTLETLATAVKVAEQAVEAYCSGSRRLVDTLDAQVAQRAADGAEPYVPQLAAVMRRSSSRVNRWAMRRIDAVGRRTDALLNAGSAQVAAQVRRLARVAGGVQNPMVSGSLDAAARWSLPGAKAALAVTTRVAQAAGTLQGRKPSATRRAAPQAVAESVAAATSKARSSARRAAAQQAPVPARSVKRAKAVPAEQAAAPASRARRATKKAAEELSAAAKPAVRAARQRVKSAKAAAKPVVDAVQSAAAAE